MSKWFILVFLSGLTHLHSLSLLPTKGTFNAASSSASKSQSLSSYLERTTSDQELVACVLAVAEACAAISNNLARLPLIRDELSGGETNVQGETQQGMDVLANTIFLDNVRPFAAVLASEEEEALIEGDGTNFEIAFDPLDGSSNLDISVPTG